MCSVCEDYSPIVASLHSLTNFVTVSSINFLKPKLTATVIHYVLIPIQFILLKKHFLRTAVTFNVFEKHTKSFVVKILDRFHYSPISQIT